MRAISLFALLVSLLLTGCSQHKQAQVNPPAPPSIAAAPPPANTEASEAPAGQDQASSDEDAEPARTLPNASANSKTKFEETGLASWYGGVYNKRRGADGQIYNMHDLTAAHRTLPLGSRVRVTNLKTGSSAVVRITDRGPFIKGRILDLSQAAAKKTDVYLAGVAMVRIEVLDTPVPLNSGGRWAVQIGAFEQEHAANQLVSHLSRQYQTARVLCFSSPIGEWWVRVRVQDDDRGRAEAVAHNTHTPEGNIFLVRLD